MQYKFQQLSKALDVLKAVPTPLGKNGQTLREKRQLKSDFFLKDLSNFYSHFLLC